jgi:CPA2 family monovalent cation:H+ antiporter-2
VLAVVAVVVVGKALAALLIVMALGGRRGVALTVAVGLAQIGEFSFILVEMGRSLQLLPEEAVGLVLAAALVSITVNPLLLRMVAPLEARARGRRPGRPVAEAG